MSIKHGLLALLERGPMYGYQLRTAFEESTGGTWPLNIGQVYTTLGRLERDDLVRSLPEHDGRQRSYEITEAGRAELALWFATPVSRADRPRDELAIKLALALTTPGVDVRAVLQNQRTATMRTLQEYTRLKAGRRQARPTCRGGSCSTRCCSRPRPRCAGSTTARPRWSGTAGGVDARPPPLAPHRPRAAAHDPARRRAEMSAR